VNIDNTDDISIIASMTDKMRMLMIRNAAITFKGPALMGAVSIVVNETIPTITPKDMHCGSLSGCT
jgi:hypothetical protein